VGGGGRFASVGGTEIIQKDQLSTLKSIDRGITRLAQGSTANSSGVQ